MHCYASVGAQRAFRFIVRNAKVKSASAPDHPGLAIRRHQRREKPEFVNDFETPWDINLVTGTPHVVKHFLYWFFP